MARMARVVVPGQPHHVTQRGARRQRTFFRQEDYKTYLTLYAAASAKACVSTWAYCLMPNHVHLIVVPEYEHSLADLFRFTHGRYTQIINKRKEWRGHLWQERFHSTAMDELHLLTAVRYVEMNPVRAALVSRPQDWVWSSVHAHVSGKDDSVVTVAPMLDRIGNWLEYLEIEDPPERYEAIRRNEATGRPLGSDHFLTELELRTGRQLHKLKPGPKARRHST